MIRGCRGEGAAAPPDPLLRRDGGAPTMLSMRWGQRLCFAALFCVLWAERTGVLADLPEEADRIVHYTIHAVLDPAAKEISGDMELVWRNATDRPVPELYFHLYLNAFESRDSSYLRQSGGAGKRGAAWDEDWPGFVRIDSMTLPDGVNLWMDGTREFVAPDDGNEKDRTLARVALPAPVPPGETIALKVDFTSRLPRVLHRTGWAGDPDDPGALFFMVAQWFPKVAVLRPGVGDGEPRWNAHQFHRNTEFFSDYGEYRVSITVPEAYVVGATGVRVSETRNGDGTKTVQHRQSDVHDFAWTASPHFIVHDFTWEFGAFLESGPPGMRDRIRELQERTARHRGVDPESIRPRKPVAVRLLLQPDHGALAARFRPAVEASLACYALWFGPYPYDVLTVVDPPAGGPAAGGMEYPTLITVWGDRLAPDYSTGMEGVTIHEFGHQYFYGLLGSNEFEEAWLDEGFTSYTDARVHEIAYGPTVERTRYGPFDTPYWRPFDPPRVFASLRRVPGLGSVLDRLPHPWAEPDALLPAVEPNPFWAYLRDMPAVHFADRVPVPQPFGEREWWLAANTHDAMVLPGWHFAGRSDYAVNSYGKPTLFLYALRGLLGEEAFDRAMYAYASTQRFQHPTTDDFLAIVRSHAPEEQAAFVDAFLRSMTDTAERLDAAIVEASQRKVGEQWEWTVKVQRRGSVPVPIEVVGEGVRGQPEVLATWASEGRETTRTFRFTRDEELAAVRIGPDWIRYLDGDLSNNARRLGGSDARPAAALTARWTLFVEDVLRTYAGVAR